MSTKYFCDFCGEEIKDRYDLNMRLIKQLNQSPDTDVRHENHDVCGHCANQIRMFFKKLLKGGEGK